MVFVLDARKRPLMPCSEKRARKLLAQGRAVVHRVVFFVIRLKDRRTESSDLQALKLKIDPGYEATGISVVRVAEGKEVAVFFAELHHRMDIRERLDARRARRRSRRNRKTRYRAPRLDNRRRPEGWLPPSAEARVRQVLSVVEKLRRWLPVAEIVVESVKFDTRKLQDPEVSGIEYQRGELFGYRRAREYLLEKWGRRCAWCGREGVPLEVSHVVPKSRGGTERVSNLVLSCQECAEARGNRLPQEWLEELMRSGRDADRRRAENIPKILARLKEPLKGAALMNATRYVLMRRLEEFGLPVSVAPAVQTDRNRARFGLPKTHYFDACCAGEVRGELEIAAEYVLHFRATGRGTRQMCIPDRHGFPRGHRSRHKLHCGFMTGDLVAAEVPRGKYAGRYVGFAAVRASGYFDIKDFRGKRVAQGISHRYCRLVQRYDGYSYGREVAARYSSQ